MKPILLISPPRSGSTVTARIIQDHIGPWPFEVNQYAEPQELLDIQDEWQKRHDKYWMLLKKDPPVDERLEKELTEWIQRQEDCVIKAPVFSLINSVLCFSNNYDSIFLKRDDLAVAKSLMKHKREAIDLAFAKETVDWMNDTIFIREPDVYFSKWYKADLQHAIEQLGIEWDEEVFDAHYNESEIHNDSKD